MKTYEMTDDRTEFDRYKAFFCNDGLLAEYRQKTAEAMQVFESPDYEMYRPYMIDAYFPYSTRSEAQKADFNIAMFAVAQNENNYQYVPEKLRTPEFHKTAFKFNPRLVTVLPSEVVQHPDNHMITMIAKYRPEKELLEAIKFNYFQHVAAQALSVNPSLYMELNDNLQRDQQLIHIACNKPANSNIKDEFYARNRAYVQEVLELPIPNTPNKPKTMADARAANKPLPPKGYGPVLKPKKDDDKK